MLFAISSRCFSDYVAPSFCFEINHCFARTRMATCSARTSGIHRMRDFNDWAQCMLLEVVSRHEPKDQSELIDIMNLLETRLKSTNCGVILAITKVFLHLTSEIPKLHKQARPHAYTCLLATICTAVEHRERWTIILRAGRFLRLGLHAAAGADHHAHDTGRPRAGVFLPPACEGAC